MSKIFSIVRGIKLVSLCISRGCVIKLLVTDGILILMSHNGREFVVGRVIVAS